MSLTILSYMHVLCRQLIWQKKHFSRYNHPHILCMCSKALQSDDRLLCDIEISGKTQNYRLKSVCNFKVTRFYLILTCKQHNWTSGTSSIEIYTRSYENRVRQTFCNFSQLLPSNSLFTVLFAYVVFFFFLALRRDK